MNTTDPIELIVAEALDRANIVHVHESDNKGQLLDFYLPIQDIFIECKQFPTERTGKQIESIPNVIVIQGRRAAQAFAHMITSS